MNTNVRSHDEYLSFVCTQIESQNISKYFIRDFYFDTIIWTSLINLTQTAELLKHRYSTDPRGRKPRNPNDMLRSLLLMHYQKITSVDKWVYTLKTNPLMAILSGFSPDNVPGVGTFYDFFNRLWLAQTPYITKQKKKKLKKPRKKREKESKTCT